MCMLLKMVILLQRENLIKAIQSYEYIVSLIFKYKMQVPITLLLFWITQGSPSRASPYFFVQKNISLLVIETMLKRDMEFRPFYFFVRQFVCNLKIPLRNSVITPFKVLNISIAGCRIFCSWIEAEPLNKSILLSI